MLQNTKKKTKKKRLSRVIAKSIFQITELFQLSSLIYLIKLVDTKQLVKPHTKWHLRDA